MSLLPHQQRVVGEYEELRTRTIALGNFLPSKTCLELDQAEQARLRKQWNLMNEYGQVLAERIAAFKPISETPGSVCLQK